MQKASKNIHVVFHMEGETDTGEVIAIARESHKFSETATIGQLEGEGWALAQKLTGMTIEIVVIEIDRCGGGDDGE